MSVIAALDSGGDALSVALHINGKIANRRGTAESPQAEQLLPLLMGLLSDNGLDLDGCGAFAFAAGPGKFSALRLVCAVAKTFAYAKNKPLIAVPSFAALAEANAASGAATIKCALPAHRGHVYFGVCRREKSLWRAAPARIVAANAAPPLADIKDACGEGFLSYPQLLGGATFHTAPTNAAAVARIAAAMLANGETTPPLECEPLYVRKHIALTTAQREKMRNCP